MLAALVFEDWYPFLTIPAAILRPGEKLMPKGDLIIAPQHQFGSYRLDILIIGQDDNGHVKQINVECDGEEWHNSAVVQYQDGPRDEYLRACGIEVMRFRGPEIWDDAQGCAEEVALSLKRWHWLHWSNAVGKAVVKAA